VVDNINFEEDADLIVLTGMLRHIPRAIDIAKEFQKRGKPSIIGGPGAFAIRDEITKSNCFASHVVGEVDELWGSILDDFEKGRLKAYYECTTPPQLNGLPPARFDLLDLKKYMNAFWDRNSPIIPIETSRGCPRDCNFCLVTRYFGKKIRYRPIGEVIDEIKHHGSKFVMFTDDNITINKERARELFIALKPLNIHWLAQFETSVASQPELLKLAYDSGCASAFVGIESLVSSNLDSINKSHNAKLDFKEVVKNFKKAKIPLLASLIFGMDEDTPDSIEWTMEQMIVNRVDVVIPWILTPVPGTHYYDDIKKNGRIIHDDYSRYDYWHSIIKPKRMTSNELEAAFWKGMKRFYNPWLIFKRFMLAEMESMTGLLYHIYFYTKIRKGIHPFDSAH
jgi:radical SAM superfamily enzyme YgiQ (UPF0313 family)